MDLACKYLDNLRMQFSRFEVGYMLIRYFNTNSEFIFVQKIMENKLINAEIIAIGDELLIGQVTDTNSTWLGKMLNKYGIKISRINVISDDKESILSQLEISRQRASLIIMTGGLGPTKDDITKNTLVTYFKTNWRTDEDVLQQLTSFYKSRGREMLEVNRLQANLPANCITLNNTWGTAPGMWFDLDDNKVLISMPGVPYEMKNIFEHVALPRIIKQFKQPTLYHKTIVVINIPESIIAKNIEEIENLLPSNIKLAYLPHMNIVRLRLTGRQINEEDIIDRVNKIAMKIKDILGNSIVAMEDLSMAQIIYNNLHERNQTLSIAESCTGGYISHQMTLLPGASKVFVGSVISYSNSVKHHQLGVESTLFETVGAVSEQVVTQMVEGVRQRLATDYAIAVSGIAGPDGGSTDKPVGTTVIGVCSKNRTIVKTYQFVGDRMNVIERASNTGFELLRQLLLENTI